MSTRFDFRIVGRVLAAWCLILGFLSIQLASSFHPLEQDGDHACAVCKVSHAPIVQTTGDVRLSAPLLLSWTGAIERPATAELHYVKSKSSRAPPVS